MTTPTPPEHTDERWSEMRHTLLKRTLKRFADIAEHDIGEDERDDDLFKSMSADSARAPVLTVGMVRDAAQAYQTVLALIAENERLRSEAFKDAMALKLGKQTKASLRSRVAELEGALKRFADIAEHDIGQDEADDDLFKPMPPAHAKAFPLTVGMFRTARAALSRDGEE